jgi:uncharacterized protein (TIGR02246 family)
MATRSARKLRAHGSAADEAAIRTIPRRMIEAWNRGDAAAFAAPFTDTADFIAFDGTHLVGRSEIAAFHEALFAAELKGTRLEGEAVFVRLLTSDLAVLHARAGTILAGEELAIPSRESMQLFVVTRHGGEWLAEAMLNARRLTVDQQLFADEFESLAIAEQGAVKDRVRFLRDGLKGVTGNAP